MENHVWGLALGSFILEATETVLGTPLSGWDPSPRALAPRPRAQTRGPVPRPLGSMPMAQGTLGSAPTKKKQIPKHSGNQ